jgi:hypothetical protein
MGYGTGAYGTQPYGGEQRAVSAGLDILVASAGSHSEALDAAPDIVPEQPPPAAAERMLRWIIPLKLQDAILGDLAEMYADTHAKFGPREARRLYWWHALRSVAPVLRQAAVRWSALVWLGEWLRRTFWS